MAVLWFPRDGEWTPVALPEGDASLVLALGTAGAPQQVELQAGLLPGAEAWLSTPAGARSPSLLARSAGVRVNGDPAEVRPLRERDEILFEPGLRLYFSRESAREALPFPKAQEGIYCPRCKLLLEAGQLAVACECGVWFHALPDRPCYGEGESQCPACARDLIPIGECAWRPDDVR